MLNHHSAELDDVEHETGHLMHYAMSKKLFVSLCHYYSSTENFDVVDYVVVPQQFL